MNNQYHLLILHVVYLRADVILVGERMILNRKHQKKIFSIFFD